MSGRFEVILLPRKNIQKTTGGAEAPVVFW